MRWPSVSDAVSDTLLIWVKAQSGTRYVVAIVCNVSPAWADIGSPLSHNSIGTFAGTTRRNGSVPASVAPADLILLASISWMRANLSRLT